MPHGQHDQPGHPPEQRAPPRQGQKPLHGQRGCDHADRTGHQHPGVGPHLYHGSEPASVTRQRRHQAGTDACADQQPPCQQCGKAPGQREHHTADHGHTQKPQLDLAGSQAVQPAAQGQLRGGKSQKVATGQQPQVARMERELLRQQRCQGRRDGPQQRGQKVGKCKRQKNGDSRPRRQRGHCSTSPANNWSACAVRGCALSTIAWQACTRGP